jgi:hypothetical protein
MGINVLHPDTTKKCLCGAKAKYSETDIDDPQEYYACGVDFKRDVIVCGDFE